LLRRIIFLFRIIFHILVLRGRFLLNVVVPQSLRRAAIVPSGFAFR
jgi:hypothetical protein